MRESMKRIRWGNGDASTVLHLRASSPCSVWDQVCEETGCSFPSKLAVRGTIEPWPQVKGITVLQHRPPWAMRTNWWSIYEDMYIMSGDQPLPHCSPEIFSSPIFYRRHVNAVVSGIVLYVKPTRDIRGWNYCVFCCFRWSACSKIS